MAIKLKVTQVRSGINRPEQHKIILKGLGLGKMHRTVLVRDNAAIRGMIRHVSHLVRVEVAE